MTWKATRTKRLQSSSALRPAARSHNYSRHARSFAGCSRISSIPLWPARIRNMLHLSPERLAALADDEPLAAEASHLASCARCSAERAAHRRLLTLAHREAMQPGE